jgi:F-type H+-transporting ATPase subunit a
LRCSASRAFWFWAPGGAPSIPSRLQSVAELVYGFIYNMVEDVTGHDGVKYFPYIMTLFMFILFANFLGLSR